MPLSFFNFSNLSNLGREQAFKPAVSAALKIPSLRRRPARFPRLRPGFWWKPRTSVRGERSEKEERRFSAAKR